MATIGEVKKELRYREWAEEIAECQSSGMAVRYLCRMKGLSSNTYYRRLRVLRTCHLSQTEQSMQPIVPISATMSLQTSDPKPIKAASTVDEKVLIRKSGIEVELPQNISEHILLTLLRGLREC